MQIFTYLCMSVTACTVVVEVCCISDAGYDFVQACHKQKGAEKPIQEHYTIEFVLATGRLHNRGCARYAHTNIFTDS